MGKLQKRFAVLVTVSFLAFTVLMPNSASAVPNNVSIALSDPTPSTAGVTYTWTWSGYQTAGAVRCIRIEADTSADGTGSLPTGMVLTSATLTGTYGGTWTRDATSAASGVLAFNWATGVTPGAGPTTLLLGAITNSTTAGGGTYYLLITTYDTAGTGSSGACAGSTRDAQTSAAFATTAAVTASVTIDPSMALTVSAVNSALSCGDVTTTITSTATAVNLGHIAATTSHPIGGQSLQVASNAANGYTVYISQSGNMTGAVSGTVFDAHTGTNASPAAWPANGTEAFGYTTSSASLSGSANRFHSPAKWAGLSTTAYEVMRATTPVASDTNCIAFEASSAGDTPADTYSTTVRYNLVGVF